MRIKKKRNICSKKGAGQAKPLGSFSLQERGPKNDTDDSSCNKPAASVFKRRCMEMVLPDGSSLVAMADDFCSDPSLDIVLCRDGQNEVVCSVQYNTDYPEKQRLRIAAYHHDCDFAVYEGPYVEEEVFDGT